MARVPEDGDALNLEDAQMIIEAFIKRRENFPAEPSNMTLALILLNIGDRFATVTCIEEEWTSLVQDIPKGTGVPKCPNGHVLTKGPGMHLAWMSDPSEEEVLEKAAEG